MSAPVPVAPTTYRLVLAPGWVRLPLDDTAPAAVDAVVEHAFGGAPRDSSTPLRLRQRETLIRVVEDARGRGGLDVIFPLGTAWRIPVSVGIVVSSTEVVPVVGVPTGEVVAVMARNLPDASVVDTVAGPALREERQLSAGPAPENGHVVHRSVVQSWPVPHSPGRLLLASYSITGPDDPEVAPVVEALVLLVDTMLGSLDWQYEGGEAVTP